MKLDARHVAPPLAAIAILALILTQTREALNLSGAWRRAHAAAAMAPTPFATLEREIAGTPPPRAEITRDPLRAPSAPVAAVPLRPRSPVVVAPPPRPTTPVLTSIVFDADPRATLRWEGREYSVRPNGLFAEFRVLSIAREQVVLERAGESVVLRLPKRGEP